MTNNVTQICMIDTYAESVLGPYISQANKPRRPLISIKEKRKEEMKKIQKNHVIHELGWNLT